MVTMMGDVIALRAKPPSLFNRSAHSAEPTPKIRASVHWLLCCFVALSFAVCSENLSYGFIGTHVST